MTRRTVACSKGVLRERLRKAEEFHRVGIDALAVADDEADVTDAAATLFVTSGIASADVICCARLEKFAQGDDHRQAVSLLREADEASAASLSVLLELKARAAYSHVRITAAELLKVRRAADKLLENARRIATT